MTVVVVVGWRRKRDEGMTFLGRGLLHRCHGKKEIIWDQCRCAERKAADTVGGADLVVVVAVGADARWEESRSFRVRVQGQSEEAWDLEHSAVAARDVPHPAADLGQALRSDG